jgi:protein subunit release factor B
MNILKIFIPESDEELLNECEVETMRSGGAGGQHVNKTDSAVRLRHIPTGITVRSEQSRSQHRNKDTALYILRKKLEDINKVKKPRVKTRISRSTKEKNLLKKKKHSQTKKNRRKEKYSEE